MITYKAIIEYFDVICERHQQINSFTYGKKVFYDKEKFTKYPAVHLSLTGFEVQDQVVVYGFDISVFDRYNHESNEMRNEATCISDSALILQDLCKEFTEGKFFINPDTNISLQLPVSAVPIFDEDPDMVTGWTTPFDIITPNEVSPLNIPYFESERQNALVYTLPDSAKVCAWYSRERIHNQTTFSGQELVSIAPVFDNVSGSDVMSMTGSAVTWNPQKNAFHMYDVSNTIAMNLQHSAVTETEATFFIRIKDFKASPIDDGASPQDNYLFYGGDVVGFTDGFDVRISASSSTLILTSWHDTDFVESEFPICPNNADTSDNMHRRLEPLTICVQVKVGKIVMWYGMTAEEKVELSSTFEFDNDVFGIGHPNVFWRSDFFLQEFVYIPDELSNTNITQIMQWLNYR